MSKNEAAIEAEIQSKGLNAPRLNPQHIDDTIAEEAYHVFPGTTLTVCALTLKNGFCVVGESAAASPSNFDEAIGRKIARENARNKIWALEGYLLRSQLAEAAVAVPADEASAKSPKMRAKMRVGRIQPYPAEGEPSQEALTFNAVAKDGPYPSDGSDEDNSYAKFSPAGTLSLTVANPALLGKFNVGDKFYLDFTPIE